MSPFDEDPSENRSELELCIDEIHQLQTNLSTLKAENQSFGNVLAVIHGDGGHYITKHGHDKASEDAIQIVLDSRAENERLRDALQSLYDEQNGPPLLRDKKEWQAAMDEAETLLGTKP